MKKTIERSSRIWQYSPESFGEIFHDEKWYQDAYPTLIQIEPSEDGVQSMRIIFSKDKKEITIEENYSHKKIQGKSINVICGDKERKIKIKPKKISKKVPVKDKYKELITSFLSKYKQEDNEPNTINKKFHGQTYSKRMDDFLKDNSPRKTSISYSPSKKKKLVKYVIDLRNKRKKSFLKKVCPERKFKSLYGKQKLPYSDLVKIIDFESNIKNLDWTTKRLYYYCAA